MEPANDHATDRRTEPPVPRYGGKRWRDDPDLIAAVERVLLQLSDDLNAARDLHVWSQEDIAAAAGIAPNTVLEIEKTRIDPHISTIVRLAFAAGMDVDLRFRRRLGPPRLPQSAAVNLSASAASQ
jgi:DNA-binding XRE family transcriptional regulator